jgi:hypothetical protein
VAYKYRDLWETGYALDHSLKRKTWRRMTLEHVVSWHQVNMRIGRAGRERDGVGPSQHVDKLRKSLTIWPCLGLEPAFLGLKLLTWYRRAHMTAQTAGSRAGAWEPATG